MPVIPVQSLLILDSVFIIQHYPKVVFIIDQSTKDSSQNQRLALKILEQKIKLPVIWDAMTLMWGHKIIDDDDIWQSMM